MRVWPIALLLVAVGSCGRSRIAALDPREAGAATGPSPDAGAPSPEARPAEPVVDAMGGGPGDVAEAGAGGSGMDGSADTEAASEAPVAPRAYKAIAVTSGRYHACALLEDHRVKCWGDNDYGQLGLGDRIDRGADSAEMGDN